MFELYDPKASYCACDPAHILKDESSLVFTDCEATKLAEPVTFKLPVNKWVSFKVSPNIVEPLLNEDVTILTDELKIYSLAVIFPVITTSPSTVPPVLDKNGPVEEKEAVGVEVAKDADVDDPTVPCTFNPCT